MRTNFFSIGLILTIYCYVVFANSERGNNTGLIQVYGSKSENNGKSLQKRQSDEEEDDQEDEDGDDQGGGKGGMSYSII
jgi:hypothetical protein